MGGAGRAPSISARFQVQMRKAGARSACRRAVRACPHRHPPRSYHHAIINAGGASVNSARDPDSA